MDFTYPPEAEAFRTEYRDWLATNFTEEYRGLGFSGNPSDDQLARLRHWNHRLADAGYAAISWPIEHGGRAATVMEQVVFAEESVAAGIPITLNPIGLANIAPSIMAFGTDEQRSRFLRPMLRGDDIWCQGFSEPDAGSDLASLSCAAIATDDGWRINGQKVWTTFGSLATWCELLVRTDVEAPSHRGITCLLIDMALPGIEVRPLVTATGDADFCELFFTDVDVAHTALLGKENDGWTVAMATLTFERGGVAALHLQLRQRIQAVIELARVHGRASDPHIRQRLAEIYIGGEQLRYLADRAVSRAAQDLPPGAESSLLKIVWSTVSQLVPIVSAEILGMAATASVPTRELMASRSLSIAGGTTEVNRNIVAERVLGLPREPRPSAGPRSLAIPPARAT